jgi:photosystem II stability/assembly factor-like uncharacterized protein
MLAAELQTRRIVLKMRAYISGLVAVGAIALTTSIRGETWVASPFTESFSWIASAADGASLVIAGGSGVYASSNYGATWVSNNISATCAASSADGSALVVGASSGGIYASTDHGATWTRQSSLAYGFFHDPASVALSADGKKLVALLLTGPVFVSTNLGATWATNSPITNWTGIACSADGNKLVATAGDAVWRSTDGGSTWTSFHPGYSAGDWQAVAMSADGTKVAVAAHSVHAIYTSLDSGATWSSNYINGQYWNAIATSADGMKLAAASSQGIYTSTNSGVGWVKDTAPFLNWFSVAASADGNRFAAITPRNLCTSYSTPNPTLNITSLDDGVRISWTVPSTNFVLQQCSDLSGGWVSVSSTPTLDMTNLQEEVVLTKLAAQSFFRLMGP